MPSVIALSTGERFDFQDNCYCYHGSDGRLHFLPQRTVSGCLRILRHEGRWVLDARKCDTEVRLSGIDMNRAPHGLPARAVINVGNARLLFVAETADLPAAVAELKARSGKQPVQATKQKLAKASDDPFSDIVVGSDAGALPPQRPAHELAAAFSTKEGKRRAEDTQTALTPAEISRMTAARGAAGDVDGPEEGTVTRELHDLYRPDDKRKAGDEMPSDGAIGAYTGIRAVDGIASSDESSFSKPALHGHDTALRQRAEMQRRLDETELETGLRAGESLGAGEARHSGESRNPPAPSNKRTASDTSIEGDRTAARTGRAGRHHDDDDGFGDATEISDHGKPRGSKAISARNLPANDSARLRLDDDGALEPDAKGTPAFSDSDLSGTDIAGESSAQTATADEETAVGEDTDVAR